MIIARTISMPALFALCGFLSPLGQDLLNDPETPVAIVAAERATPPPVQRVAPPRPTTVRRSADGLFYVNVTIKQRRMRFVLDTGASHVILSRRDAALLGLRPSRRAASVRTAGGTSRSSWTHLPEVFVGGNKVARVDALLMEAGPPHSLLGLNVLARIGRVQISGDQLTLG